MLIVVMPPLYPPLIGAAMSRSSVCFLRSAASSAPRRRSGWTMMTLLDGERERSACRGTGSARHGARPAATLAVPNGVTALECVCDDCGSDHGVALGRQCVVPRIDAALARQ